jgi:hypothetical protein
MVQNCYDVSKLLGKLSSYENENMAPEKIAGL